MSYLAQNLISSSILEFFVITLLSACSINQNYKYQVNGSDKYLHAVMHPQLKAPSGIIMPLRNDTYDIYLPLINGKVGKKLDIRPPTQIFALLKNSHGQFINNTAMIFFQSNLSVNTLWYQVIQIIKKLDYSISSYNYTLCKLTTDWINFYRDDENLQYQGRYQISVQSEKNNQKIIIVKSLSLKMGTTPINEQLQIQRYAAYILNNLVDVLSRY
ncbi:outer membrane protein assembly factor BamC [Candidatus Profftia sp. (ex Adelges kitamiensis)]|uniref:outer membrane protein assembly factor BamC n=1 Tax=Candidatus Profftia sp. (ex Adelges kitamiensis) TaxID=2864218 RepID=UPI001CE33290|nr:outer membrane protein assembly factor BamC [Candidatus Profftia sp. (ex Adelges kitamiensis)]